MIGISKHLIVIGAILTFSGIFIYAYNQIPLIGKLKGDFVFNRGDFMIYLPLSSFLVISLVVTIMLNIFKK